MTTKQTNETWEDAIIREKREWSAVYDELLTVGRGIAAQLGNDWTLRKSQYDDDDYGERFVYLCHTDGRKFSLHISRYQFDYKFSVSGDYDYGKPELNISWPYGKPRPSIKCSMKRDVKTLTRDIERRFMPDFNEAHAGIVERVRNSGEYRAKQLARSQRLAAIVACPDDRITYQGFTASSIKVELGAYDSVDVNIDGCSEDLASALLAVIAAHRTTNL